MLNVEKALKSPLEVCTFKSSVSVDFDSEAFADNKVDSTAVINMNYHADYDDVIHINGFVDVPCSFVCDRCAGAFQKNLYFEFDEMICKKSDTDEDDDGFAYDDNGNVDINEVVKNLIITNFPTKILCKPDCKGICQTCGVNLNDQECEHQTKKIGKNNPFISYLFIKLSNIKKVLSSSMYIKKSAAIKFIPCKYPISLLYKLKLDKTRYNLRWPSPYLSVNN